MKNLETATFAAGCFWGPEYKFRQLNGVEDAAVGFMGGHTQNPTYKEVCYEGTGHAEVIQLYFDPNKISYKELLNHFWDMINPTQETGQGVNIGDQYRSAIFYHSDAQKTEAEASKAALDASGKYDKAVVTEIVPAQDFYKAEEYHQQYIAKTGRMVC